MREKTYNRNIETEFSRKVWVPKIWIISIFALFIYRLFEIKGWLGLGL